MEKKRKIKKVRVGTISMYSIIFVLDVSVTVVGGLTKYGRCFLWGQG